MANLSHDPAASTSAERYAQRLAKQLRGLGFLTSTVDWYDVSFAYFDAKRNGVEYYVTVRRNGVCRAHVRYSDGGYKRRALVKDQRAEFVARFNKAVR